MNKFINAFLTVAGLIGIVLACNESNHYFINIIGVMMMAGAVCIYNFKKE